MVPSLPLLSCESSVSVKENPDRKKKKNSDLLPMALSLELRYNFYIWDPSSQLSRMVFIFVFFFFMSSSAFFHLCLLLFSCHPLLSGCSDFLKKNAISREKQMFKIFIIL